MSETDRERFIRESLESGAFGEGSTDYSAYLACMNSPHRQALRTEYDKARAAWEELDNFLKLGGQTATGPALMPGYSSVAEMQTDRDAYRGQWESLLTELRRTEEECNKIAPVVKTAQQLAEETFSTLESYNQPYAPPPTTSGAIPPSPTDNVPGFGTTTIPINPTIAVIPPVTATGGQAGSGSVIPEVSPQGAQPLPQVNVIASAPLPKWVIPVVVIGVILLLLTSEG